MPDPKKQRAGRKGGQAVSKDRAHMAAIGRKGGQRSRVKRSDQSQQKEQTGSQVAASEEKNQRVPEQSRGHENSQHGGFDDPIEMIKADHRHINSLFEDYETAGGEDKVAIAERIMKELQVHAAIEEEIFYPAFKEKAGTQGRDQVAEALEEHQLVKTALHELRTMEPDDDAFDSAFQDMMHDVQHHVSEEEEKMLPLAEEILAEDLEELGTEMQRRKHDLTESIATEALH